MQGSGRGDASEHVHALRLPVSAVHCAPPGLARCHGQSTGAKHCIPAEAVVKHAAPVEAPRSGKAAEYSGSRA